MSGEKRGESLSFQAGEAAGPKIVEMGSQTVERGIQTAEFYQPDYSGIFAIGTLHHPQKESKRPEMPTDRKNGGVEVQEEEWEDDTTVGFVPGNGGPRNQGLFLPAREGREFAQVLQGVQEYVSSKYATLLTGHGDADVKAQIKRYITKYIQDYRTAVQGVTMVQLMDRLYIEMAGFSSLARYISGTGIEEMGVNGWNNIEVQYDDGRDEKLEEYFDSPEHTINVIRHVLYVSGMVLDNASPAVLGHLSKNVRIAVLKTPPVDGDVGICANIRIVSPQSIIQADFVRGGTAAGEMLDFLAECVRYGISACVAGATSPGKTILVGWILTTVPDSKRIFTIQDGSRELDLIQVKEGEVMNRIIHTLTRDSENEKQTADQDDLLGMALRFNPDIACVGEMRSSETYSAQEAARTGHTVLTAIYSNNCESTYRGMVTLCKRKYDISGEASTPLVTEAFPIIVFSKQLKDRKRKVMETMEYEILSDGNRNYRTLYRYNIVENRLDGDRFIIHGGHERVQDISESPKKRFLENGIPKEQLV